MPAQNTLVLSFLLQSRAEIRGVYTHVSFLQIAEVYIAAIMKYGFTFYEHTPPLVFIHTLCRCSTVDYPQTVDMCVTTLCNSTDPMLKYSSGKSADKFLFQVRIIK